MAQRTSDGSLFIGGSQIVSAYVIPSGGLELHLGQYLLSSYWKASVSAVDWMQRTDTPGVSLDRLHLTAEGGWMQRLVCNYSRSLNLYGGASAFLGYNFHEVLRRLPEEFTADLPEGGFIYGVKPSLEMEFFVSSRAALLLGVHVPFTFSSAFTTDLCHLTGSLGFRINL